MVVIDAGAFLWQGRFGWTVNRPVVDMSLLRLNTNPTPRQLKGFGGCWLVFFGLITAWRFNRDGWNSMTVVLGVMAVAVPAVGWMAPRFMRWVFVGLNFLVYPIGRVLSVVILGLVYYAVVTPMGLLMKILRYDPMSRAFDKARKSYWVPREENVELQRYFKQY